MYWAITLKIEYLISYNTFSEQQNPNITQTLS